jgi:hypothetical protein
MTLTIKDETFTGDIIREIDLIFKSENITVKELITERVLQEVKIIIVNYQNITMASSSQRMQSEHSTDTKSIQTEQ